MKRKYDWNKIVQYIVDNDGKCTENQVCEKFDIPYTSTLNNYINRKCPELKKNFVNGHVKYDWKKIERYIEDNAGKYTEKQLCEKFDIPYVSTLIIHIQKSCPELKKNIVDVYAKYNWSEIDQFIASNSGKYTRLQICEKFNISCVEVLNKHIKRDSPELKKCLKHGHTKHNWKKIERYIEDNISECTRTQICEKFNISCVEVLGNHVRKDCPELKKCIRDRRKKLKTSDD